VSQDARTVALIRVRELLVDLMQDHKVTMHDAAELVVVAASQTCTEVAMTLNPVTRIPVQWLEATAHNGRPTSRTSGAASRRRR
jgi:hypothetical protein